MNSCSASEKEDVALDEPDICTFVVAVAMTFGLMCTNDTGLEGLGHVSFFLVDETFILARKGHQLSWDFELVSVLFFSRENWIHEGPKLVQVPQKNWSSDGDGRERTGRAKREKVSLRI